MGKPKIIIFDLETLPNLNKALEHWCELSSRWETKTMKATVSTIICAGWKELGSKRTYCINAWDYESWDNDVNDDYSLCVDLYKILHDADAIVTHNGAKFDWPFLQTRLLYHGLSPLAKARHVDTKNLASKNLALINNRLNTVGKELIGDKKLTHDGWDLWVNVHRRSSRAMRTMTKYCKQDVDLLEKCFKKLLPFVHILPNRNLFRSDKQMKENTPVCPNCGSTELRSNGWRHTSTKSYRRMSCSDCGSWSRTDLKENNPRTF